MLCGEGSAGCPGDVTAARAGHVPEERAGVDSEAETGSQQQAVSAERCDGSQQAFAARARQASCAGTDPGHNHAVLILLSSRKQICISYELPGTRMFFEFSILLSLLVHAGFLLCPSHTHFLVPPSHPDFSSLHLTRVFSSFHLTLVFLFLHLTWVF